MLGRLKRVFSKGMGSEHRPVVSFVVVVYNMPEQAKKTLMSLATDYQQGVRQEDYEVIVVENESANLIDEQFISSLPPNFHYHKRRETRSTPAYAINFGASIARGEYICLMIDGARMLTPGVVKNILLGHTLAEHAVVSIPGYHLGETLQQESVNTGYGVDIERELLGSINWPQDGYGLFNIACFSGSSASGFFLPNSESNCISVPKGLWHELGGYDVRFDLRGGGLINLDFYKRACQHPSVQHVIIPGEGTFHQFHGGVTTGGEERQVRDIYIEDSKEQYRKLRGAEYSSPSTNPVFLGQLSEQSQKFLHLSSGKWMRSKGEKPLQEFN